MGANPKGDTMNILLWKISVHRIGHGFYAMSLFDFIKFVQLGRFRVVLTK